MKKLNKMSVIAWAVLNALSTTDRPLSRFEFGLDPKDDECTRHVLNPLYWKVGFLGKIRMRAPGMSRKRAYYTLTAKGETEIKDGFPIISLPPGSERDAHRV